MLVLYRSADIYGTSIYTCIVCQKYTFRSEHDLRFIFIITTRTEATALVPTCRFRARHSDIEDDWVLYRLYAYKQRHSILNTIACSSHKNYLALGTNESKEEEKIMTLGDKIMYYNCTVYMYAVHNYKQIILLWWRLFSP